MFIVCGVLYAIDSVTERNTKIVLAVDLYRGFVLSDVNLSFTNPFKNTTMALYNPETKVKIICLRTVCVSNFIDPVGAQRLIGLCPNIK